jgi:PAS domain S-box-containing protein
MVVSALLAATVAERTRVENALRMTQQDLERRVQERTVELAQANAVLKAEIADRTEAQAKLKQLNETLEQRVVERSAAAERRSQELAESEAALRRQRGVLQSILDSIGDSVVVVDAKARVILFNPAAQRLLQPQLRGITVDSGDTTDLRVSGDLDWRRLLQRAVQGASIDGEEIVIRSIDGTKSLWLSATGRPFVDEPGKPAGAVVVFRDVTSHRLLEKQIIEISDREQCRMGQELHDGLCQHLVGIGFAVELLREHLAQKGNSESVRAETISDMVNQSITLARQLARGLYPVRLDIDGLPSALDELAQRIRNQHSVECDFTCEGSVLIHDPAAGFNLYRIAQEAVNNAVKHGQCSRIQMCLEAVEDEITLTIKDNGVGIPQPPSNPEGMGLHIMNYRAQVIGAALHIRRGIGGGSVVTCSYRNEKRKDNVPVSAS